MESSEMVPATSQWKAAIECQGLRVDHLSHDLFWPVSSSLCFIPLLISLCKTLESSPGQQSWIDVIKRDTDRQFPFHEMFQSKDSHG